MDEIRAELRERFKYEPPLVHEGMGDCEFIALDHLISVQNQIEVDYARFPFRTADAAQFFFDFK